MADISVTAANVKITSNTVFKKIQLGEAGNQGDFVYLKASDQKYWLVINSSEATTDAKGVLLTPNIADGYAIMATSGDVDMGATLTIPDNHTVSSTAGKAHPAADLASGEWVGEVGTVKTAALLTLDFEALGAQHP